MAKRNKRKTTADKEEDDDERETLSVEEAERIVEEESWINQDSSERKPVSPLLFFGRLDASNADEESNRLVLKRCKERMEAALSLTPESKDEESYIRVLARDPQKREHQLRFSRNDDVQQGTFILHHEWANIVNDNGLKEGDLVAGRGNFIDHQFRVVLSFSDVVRKTGVISRERKEKNRDDRFIWLFEKKLDGGDQKELVIDNCSEKLKMFMQRTTEPYVRVVAADPKNVYFELRLSRSDQQGTYILCSEWENLVARNRLKEGDTVMGFGGILGLKSGIRVDVHFIKNGKLDRAIQDQQQFFFFDKKLESPDTDTRLGRLEIVSCKEVVREIVARAEKVEGSDGYVRVSATDDKYRRYELRLSRYEPIGGYALHQWGNVVTAYGLMSGDKVTCWGCFNEDGTIWMKIDVDKAPENVGLEP